VSRCAFRKITGATVQLAARLQINTLIRPVHDGIHPEPLFPNVTSTYVPLLWFERVRFAVRLSPRL
jgi:hypothetical protein